MELLNTSVYESPILMGSLFFLGGIALFLIVAITPKDKQSPMYYTKKTELPEDDTVEKSSHFFWILILVIIILYYIL